MKNNTRPITLKDYSGHWHPLTRPRPPKAGTLVRVHSHVSLKEIGEFKRLLTKHNLQFGQLIKWMPALDMNVYRIVKKSVPAALHCVR